MESFEIIKSRNCPACDQLTKQDGKCFCKETNEEIPIPMLHGCMICNKPIPEE